MKHVLGFDPGYGDIKESYRDDSGKIVNRKYSSVVAEAPEEASDMPKLDGKRYYMGGVALARSSNDIIELTDYLHLEQVAPLFLWKTLEDLGREPDYFDKIVTGLSFAQIQQSEKFLKRIQKFRVNGKTYDFNKRIMLVPQGVGAKYAIDYFFPDGPDTYLIIDIGQSTIDVVDVISGMVRPENVHGYANEGIVKIGRSLQDYIAKTFHEHVSLKEVKEILEEKSFFLEGEDYDLTDVIADLSKDYTQMTMANLKDRFSREFKKYRKIYFVGGGAHYIDKSVSRIIDVVPEPEFFNSIGNLLRGEKELEK